MAFKTHFQTYYDYYHIDLDQLDPKQDNKRPGGGREDLLWIRLAEKMGFVPEEGHGFADTIKFLNPKTNATIWYSGYDHRTPWVCATLENGGWINHRHYATLLEALEAEKTV